MGVCKVLGDVAVDGIVVYVGMGYLEVYSILTYYSVFWRILNILYFKIDILIGPKNL